MSLPAVPELLAMTGLPQSGKEPVFAAPWQASAFALTMSLHRAGLFAWPEWVDALSVEIKAAPQRPGETPDDAYYRQWVAALERMTIEKGLAEPGDLGTEAARWRRAYAATPHGQPVSLAGLS